VKEEIKPTGKSLEGAPTQSGSVEEGVGVAEKEKGDRGKPVAKAGRKTPTPTATPTPTPSPASVDPSVIEIKTEVDRLPQEAEAKKKVQSDLETWYAGNHKGMK